MKRITVSVSESMHERLLAIADKDSRPVAAVVRLLITFSERYMKEHDA